MSAPPTPGITGIDHLTAFSTDAPRTVNFYTELLGLRSNGHSDAPDDPGVIEVSFADSEYGPGMLTFREVKGAPRGQYGIGGTHHLALETRDGETLRQWKRWLGDHGLAVTGPYNRVYFESIYFTDPDGLILEIATRGPGWTLDETPDALGSEVKLPPPETMVGGRDEAAIAADTWPEPIVERTPEMRLKRVHHITAIGSDAGATERFFTDILGMRLVKRTVNFDNPSSPHLYFGVGDGAPGTIVTYFAYPRGSMRPVRPGAGITDHFALRVPDDDAVDAWRAYLLGRGVPMAGSQDRAARALRLHDPDGHVVEIVAEAPVANPGVKQANEN